MLTSKLINISTVVASTKATAFLKTSTCLAADKEQFHNLSKLIPGHFLRKKKSRAVSNYLHAHVSQHRFNCTCQLYQTVHLAVACISSLAGGVARRGSSTLLAEIKKITGFFINILLDSKVSVDVICWQVYET